MLKNVANNLNRIIFGEKVADSFVEDKILNVFFTFIVL